LIFGSSVSIGTSTILNVVPHVHLNGKPINWDSNFKMFLAIVMNLVDNSELKV